MNKVFNIISDRLKEPSTWQGAMLMIGALHYHLTDAQMDTVATYVSAVCGAVMVATKDNNKLL